MITRLINFHPATLLPRPKATETYPLILPSNSKRLLTIRCIVVGTKQIPPVLFTIDTQDLELYCPIRILVVPGRINNFSEFKINVDITLAGGEQFFCFAQPEIPIDDVIIVCTYFEVQLK